MASSLQILPGFPIHLVVDHVQGVSGRIIMNESDDVSAEDGSDIRAALAGDDEAYARIVRRYQPLVFRQMHRFTRDRLALEDLVQEVFVEAYFSLKGYRGTAPFLHWLRRVATRVGYRHWKRAERQNKVHDAAREAGLDMQSAPATPTDAAEIVFSCLAQLSPADRLVLTLTYLDQCDTAEISKLTGWSRTLVRVRAHRARNRFKQILENEGIEL